MKKLCQLLLLLVTLLMGMQLQAQEPKDTPESTGTVSPLFGGSGGPDDFGYIFIDSTDPDCAFQFVDISATGALVVSGDDVSSGPITLQEDFFFYGDTFTEMVMTSNGYLSTDPTDTGPDLSNDCPLPVVPSTGGGGRIYPLHDDLITNTGFFQYFANCPRPSDLIGNNGCHVFHYDEATHFGDPTPFDFQVILYDWTFEIIFQHDGRNPEMGSGSTTGIQNPAADIGLTFACNADVSIAANSAQCFQFPFAVDLAPPPPIPTLNIWSLILLALVLMAAGGLLIGRVKQA